MKTKVLLAVSCAVALVVSASSQAADDRVYASLLVQYVLPDGARNLQNTFGEQVAIGMPVWGPLNLEAQYYSRNFDGKVAGRVGQSGYGLDALWFFDRDGAMDPYLILGLARTTDDHHPGDVKYTARQVGLGVMDDINDNLTFRGDIRLYKNTDVFGSADFAVGLGLVYRFGEPQRTRVAVVPPVRDVDSDGDGIVDRLDQCPGTPAGSKVDAHGCVVVVVVDGDADHDGVVDSMDKCPDTTAGAKVGADGCELDSDGDGVKDSADRCPDTPAGTRVDSNGCTLAKVIKLEGVNFDTSSAVILSSSRAKLDEAVATLKQNPSVVVEVAGHTDNLGNAARNKALSQRRADSVRKYIVAAGVPEAQISAQGYGAEQPVASNATPAGRAANRRVELRVKQ